MYPQNVNILKNVDKKFDVNILKNVDKNVDTNVDDFSALLSQILLMSTLSTLFPIEYIK